MPKCMIGMSGGVDSSVAAYLLKQQGYDCIGVTMKLFAGEVEGSCCSADDAEDAKAVCRRLGIPHYTFNYTVDFEKHVIAPFVSEYEAGRTPNPCIRCNQHLKFQRMWQRAKELGCDFVATGHYAQVVSEDGRYRLKKAADPEKDQSYVLYFLEQEQLAHTLFPLGGLTKPQVREIAREAGFVTASKAERQDICFIPDGDYGAFMEQYTGKTYPHGQFLDPEGKVLGEHRGAVRYTLGQRKGLGVSAAARLYVTGKDMEKNTVTLGSNDDLFASDLLAKDVFLTEKKPLLPDTLLKAKIRYRQTEQPCRVTVEGETLRVVFDAPQRAICPGQAVVLYDGEYVVGGGTILCAGGK